MAEGASRGCAAQSSYLASLSCIHRFKGRTAWSRKLLKLLCTVAKYRICFCEGNYGDFEACSDRQTNGRARLEPQRVAHDNLQADVEAVPVEFANLKRLPRRRRRHIARHALEVTGTGESCAACEAAQALRARHLGQGPDAHALRVEGIVSSSETHLPTLAKKVGMEVHQTPEPCAQAVAGRRLRQRCAWNELAQ